MRIIAGESKGRKLKTVHRTGTRPTMDRVRETLFAILTPWLEESRFLDLFAGGGSVGLEALSRGARRAVFVDSNHGCAAVIRENLALLDRQHDALVIGRPWNSAVAQLLSQGERFDIVFADPPYHHEEVLLKVGEKAVELLSPGGWLVLQHTVRLPLPDRFADRLVRVDERNFGETRLTLYRISENSSCESPSIPAVSTL